jgi:hypothetical protein
MPKDLGSRHKILYGVFGPAWHVTDSTSLFDYAAGKSTKDFDLSGWPSSNPSLACIPAVQGEPQPLPPLTQAQAEQSCADVTDPERRALCIMDLMATGEVGFAATYIAGDKIARNKYPKAPKLTFPADFQEGLTLPIKFTWDKATDEDEDPLTYRHYVWPVNEFPNSNDAVEVSTDEGWFGGGSKRCAWMIGLIALVLILILYFLLRKKRKGLFVLLAVLVVIAAIIAFLLCRKGDSPPLSLEVTDLKPSKAYFWKVIVEDGNGGVTESEMHRFELK